MGPAVALEQVTFAYNGTPVLNDVTLDVHPGEMVGLAGPNGSGKTTILRLASRVLTPDTGCVRVSGRNAAEYTRRELSREVGVVPQQAEVPFAFTVRDVVAMGRYAHQTGWKLADEPDAAAVQTSLVVTDTADLAGRLVAELSGGERQRAIIARALAGEPRTLLLDEPTAFLDINHQVEIFDLLDKMNRERGITILIVSHDLNLAAAYCHRLVLLKQGRVVADGTPDQVVTRQNIQRVFECEVRVERDRGTDAPYIQFVRGPGDGPRRGTVHIVGGGGSGAGLLRKLCFQGYTVSTGVLNHGDTDEATAQALGLAVVVEKPFAPISLARQEENEQLLAAAGHVVITTVYWGEGNAANLEQVMCLARAGKPLVLLAQVPAQDYTKDRRVTQLLAELRRTPTVTWATHEAEVLDLLSGARPARSAG
jgi:iron complex transport system ATP-binding protein